MGWGLTWENTTFVPWAMQRSYSFSREASAVASNAVTLRMRSTSAFVFSLAVIWDSFSTLPKNSGPSIS